MDLLKDHLADAFFDKMVGEEIEEEVEDDAENLSRGLAGRIVDDIGTDIVLNIGNSIKTNDHRCWNATTWIIAQWVVKMGGTEINPVEKNKPFECPNHEAWKTWIQGAETPYYILKQGENYIFSDGLKGVQKAPRTRKFTLCWIDVGTAEETKEESHMVTVVGDKYYDTAQVDQGFDDEMEKLHYTRQEFLSPYANFCTIWSWLFVLKVPDDREEDHGAVQDDWWVKGYIAAVLALRTPSAAAAHQTPQVASDEPDVKRHKPNPDALPSITSKMIQLRF